MELYKKLFEISRRYIEDSKTNPKLDLHRVTDMYDSVGANQISSKQWLVDEAIPYLNQDDIIMVAGAWYGVLSHLLKESGFADEATLIEIRTASMDQIVRMGCNRHPEGAQQVHKSLKILPSP